MKEKDSPAPSIDANKKTAWTRSSPGWLSGDLHLDLLRFRHRLLRFCQMNAQDPFFEFSGDLAVIGVFGQSKASLKDAVRTFDTMKFFSFIFLLLLALPPDREHPVFDGNLHILLFDLGKLCLDQIFFVALDNIHTRRPVYGRQGLFSPAPSCHYPTHEAVKTLRHLFDLPERIPASDSSKRIPACNFHLRSPLRVVQRSPFTEVHPHAPPAIEPSPTALLTCCVQLHSEYIKSRRATPQNGH